MIPVKLTLRNFMSYGSEPTVLDFSGMHVACLSGDNGNGKSALLDAITYALWGKTRASGFQASGEDDLVRLGAEEMEVQLEFRLGDDLYRAIRKRNRRTHTGEWQVHLSDNSGEWRPVGGSSMPETGCHLVRLLHMEYETFLNSAYIRQGHADEFTRQKPDARKRILAEILDLKRYDRLEDMAKERKNQCELDIKDLEGEIRHLEARVAEEPEFRARLAEHEEALAHWNAERTARESRLSTLRAQQAVLDEKAQRLCDGEDRLREAERDLAEADEQIGRLQVRIAQCDTLLARREQIEADHRRLGETRTLVERLEKEVGLLHEAQRARTEVAGRLALRKQELRTALAQAEADWKAVEERRVRIQELDAQLADAGPKLKLLERAEEELDGVRRQLAEAQQSFADLGAQNGKLKTEIAEVEEVLELLARPKPACPVCESDLSGGRQEAVILKQNGKLKSLHAILADVKRDGAACKRRRDELQERASALEAQLRGAAALRAQQIEWRKSLDEAVRLNTGAEQVCERLAELDRRWRAEEYGGEERQELQRLDARIASLEAGARQFEAARAALKELVEGRVEVLYAQLSEAETARAQLATELRQREQARGRRRGQIEVERNALAALRAELASHASVREAARGAEEASQEAATACDSSRNHVAGLKRLLEDCATAKEQAKSKSSERDRVAKDRQAYLELAAAFGKKGVQALIIANALPEVQEEANRLLARMTDNAMQVTLDTLRDKRTGGGQIETLDIRITDDAGTRPYEMYSGGEAFRVNFAIRIALSRLLAHRARARLQTLILDEGFGTQDAKGRERLVEAIESVQDEFELILVITHVEELKDAFPTRIEVIKTPAGSQITYVD